MNERLESDHFPYLPLKVELRGRVYEVEALIDTGFNGDVTMPAALLANGQPADYEVQAILADESQVSVPAYFAQAQVGRQPSFPIILLALGDEPSVKQRVESTYLAIGWQVEWLPDLSEQESEAARRAVTADCRHLASSPTGSGNTAYQTATVIA